MKYFLIIFSLITFTYTSTAQKFIYKSDKFETLSKEHKVIAILPFFTSLKLKKQKELSNKQLTDLEQKEGYAVQNALENYFLKRKKRKKFNIDFQNTHDTNAILAQNDIDYNNLDIYTAKQLCKILKVDAIINGNISINVLLSKGVPDSFNVMDFFLGKSNFGRIAVKISDGSTSKLIWKYEKEINRKLGKNTETMIEAMMKKASRKFPYDKEKKNKKNN